MIIIIITDLLISISREADRKRKAVSRRSCYERSLFKLGGVSKINFELKALKCGIVCFCGRLSYLNELAAAHISTPLELQNNNYI